MLYTNITYIKVNNNFYCFSRFSVAYEETQSNKVSNFCDFVCSSFQKAIVFDFYYICSHHLVSLGVGLSNNWVFHHSLLCTTLFEI